MYDEHVVDLVITQEVVLVYDCLVALSVTIEGVLASRPQIGTHNIELCDLFRVTCVQLKEVFTSLGYSLYLSSLRQKDRWIINAA